MALEKTLVILKPDAFKRNLIGYIFGYFAEAGLKIVAQKHIEKATEKQLNAHLPGDREWVTAMGERALGRVDDPVALFGTDDPFEIGTLIRQGCIEYYLSGWLMVIVLEGEGAVQTVRDMLGCALPSKAEKGTIRGDLGERETKGSIAATRNLVHASDSVEEAWREMAAWFTEEELGQIRKW